MLTMRTEPFALTSDVIMGVQITGCLAEIRDGANLLKMAAGALGERYVPTKIMWIHDRDRGDVYDVHLTMQRDRVDPMDQHVCAFLREDFSAAVYPSVIGFYPTWAP